MAQSLFLKYQVLKNVLSLAAMQQLLTVKFHASEQMRLDLGICHCPIVIGNYANNNGSGAHDVHVRSLEIAGNRKNGNGIMVTGDSSNIYISEIRFPDSDTMGRPIAVHWGNPDNVINGTTHPHDICISGIRIGKMGYDDTTDVGAITISGGYAITIDNVYAEAVKNGIYIYAGDYGYQYAHPKYGHLRGDGIIISNVIIKNIRDKGVYILGKSSKGQVYADLPVKVSSSTFAGTGSGNRGAGLYLNNVSDIKISGSAFSAFDRGFLAGAGVTLTTFTNCIFSDNLREGVLITSGSSWINFNKCNSYLNGRSGLNEESSGYHVTDGKYITFKNCNSGSDVKVETQKYGFKLEDDSKVAQIRIDSCAVKGVGRNGVAFSYGTSLVTGKTVLFKGNTALKGISFNDQAL